MADFDVNVDTLPQLPAAIKPSSAQPSIFDLKAHLTTKAAASYPAARMMAMTKNDLIYAVRLNP